MPKPKAARVAHSQGPVSNADLYKVYRGLVWDARPASAAHKEWMTKAIHSLYAESSVFRSSHLTHDLDSVINALYARGAQEEPARRLELAQAQAEAMADLFGQGDSGFTFAAVLPVELPGYQTVPSGYMKQEDLARIYSKLFAPAETHPEPKPTDPADIKALHLAALTYLCSLKGGEDPLLARLELARSLGAFAGKREHDAFLITESQAAWFVTLFIKRHDFQQIAPYPWTENPRIPGCNPDGLSSRGPSVRTGY
jgi:hypothetical protein